MSRFRLNPRWARGAAAAVAALTLAACQQRMAHPPSYRPLQETEFFPDRRSSRPLEEGVVHRAQLLADHPLVSGLTDQGREVQTVQILNDDGTPRETKSAAGIPNKTTNFVAEFPFPITEADLKRGQERYQIYCVPCHGTAGNGMGKIVERGFLMPPSFHTQPVDDAEEAFRKARDVPDQTPLGMSRGFSFYRDPATNANYRIPLRDVPAGYIFEVITRGYGGMPDYAAQLAPADRWRVVAYVRALQLSQNRSATEQALGGKK